MAAYSNKQSSTAPATTPTISAGSGAPATTPNKVGDFYIDTTGGKVYCSTATVDATSWKILN